MKYTLILTLVLFQTLSFAAEKLELVESVPLETSLSVPGLRDTTAVWMEMIQKATKTIDIEEFYVSDQKGEALAPVLKAIKEAAHRGVQVRLLADSKFYKTYPDSINDIGSTENSESRLLDYSSHNGIQHAKY